MTCNASSDNGYKVTKMDRYDKYETKQYTHAHTQNRRWLVLGWVTTKEDNPHLRFIAIDIWRVTSRVILIRLIEHSLQHLNSSFVALSSDYKEVVETLL